MMVDYLAATGSYGAKLTGAGGGGSVVAAAPEAKEKSIVSGLKARGFETFIARVPAKGVRSWLER
jgi:mevalonate kinase